MPYSFMQSDAIFSKHFSVLLHRYMKFDCYLTSLLASVTRMSFRRVNMGSTWPVRYSQEFRAVEVFFAKSQLFINHHDYRS